MQIQIKEVNFGIAFQTVEDGIPFILVNKHLKGFDIELYNQVIEHEIEHSKSSYIFDFFIEILDFFNVGKQKKIYSFVKRYPSSLAFLSPVIFYNRKILINSIMVVYWGVVLVALGVFFLGI